MSVEWGPPEAGLRLGIAADGASVRLLLENVGDEPLEVWSHVLAGGEVHLDWFTLRVDGREIALVDDRDRSAPVSVRLEPGGQVRHAVDVPAWASRVAEPLAAGEYQVSATYVVDPTGPEWAGRLHAGPVALAVAAPR